MIRQFAMAPFVLTTVFLFGCGQTQFSQTNGLDVSDSNIRSDLSGDVKQIVIQPNTKIPKGVFVSLTSINADFVVDLYELLYEINHTERLSGMEGSNQEITLVVLAPSNHQYQVLLSDIRRRLSISGSVPYIDVIEDEFDDDLWMQDWGEFSSVKLEGSDELVYGVFDSGRYNGRGGIDPETFSDVFQTPFIALGQNSNGSGNYGGNIEATHEGIAYVGDAISGSLVGELRDHGNENLQVIPSDWLYVGHVDEYLSFIPADNPCDAALVYADPLLGLTLAVNDSDESVLQYPGESIAEGLAYFLREGAPTGSRDLADYDLSLAGESGVEAYVRYNLELAKLILDTVTGFVDRATCLEDTIGLPQVFHEYDSWFEGSAVADAPGVTNSLVLRNHIIVPDPKMESFRRVTLERLAAASGDESTIHFIDDTVYHSRLGEVHCGTNVIREHDLIYRY